MFHTVLHYVEQHQLLPLSGEVIVAFSGGADSLCLLHLLNQLCGPDKPYPDVRLHVAHLNHQLRAEATQEAEALTRLAADWGLTMTVGSVDVPLLARREHCSIEEAARIARYRFLREVAQGQPIAVAHHMDDQVETLLLHWLRGGGISGMVGMQPRAQDIIRPLLCVSHADTVKYCEQHHLIPIEDASNFDPRFLRNRLRHELVPLLEELNPNIRATLLRNAEAIGVDVEWIETQVTNCWPDVVSEEQENALCLSRNALLALPLSLQRHLLRRVTARLAHGQSPLELRHYKVIEQLLRQPSTGEEHRVDLPQQLQMVCRMDVVIFERVAARGNRDHRISDEQEPIVLPVPGRVVVPGTPWIAEAAVLPDEVTREVRVALQSEDWRRVWHLLTPTSYAVYIDAHHVGERIWVRTRRNGDRIRPLGMVHEKKVQDVLVDKHVPRAEREQIPLFFHEGRCIWLAGITLDDRVRLTAETQRIVRLAIVPIEKTVEEPVEIRPGDT